MIAWRTRYAAGGIEALADLNLDSFERRIRLVRVPGMDSTPIGQPMTGNMTWYDTPGLGACGQWIDPATQDLVAVSSRWWTTDNPNDDPICQAISVQVSYNGTTITVPVRDPVPHVRGDPPRPEQAGLCAARTP